MKKLELTSSLGRSLVFVGPAEKGWAHFPEAERAPVVVDEKIKRLFSRLLEKRPFLSLTLTEKTKTLSTVEKIYRQFLNWGLDRNSWVISLGGGLLGDVVGFACSTYMRGMNFILTPTTFLAQVDAGVGGKTGLNFAGIKNLIGTFALPQATVVDTRFLQTLPETEIKNGLAEALKHALIASHQLFAFLERNWPLVFKKDPTVLAKIVKESLQIKLNIVSQDARESHLRRVLNFGHTFAHAAEQTFSLTHGQAVGWGMKIAIQLSARLGFLSAAEKKDILQLLKQIFPQSDYPPFNEKLKQLLWAKMEADKKKVNQEINFVFLQGIGSPKIERIPLDELKRLLNDLC